MIEGGKHQAVREEDRVIQEGLADHEREPEDRTSGILFQYGASDLTIAYRAHRAYHNRPLRLRQGVQMVLLHDFVFNHADDPVGLLEASMDHQPARALREIAPHEEDRQAKNGTHPKCQPPADVHWKEMGVEQNCRQGSADRRANPPGTVDREIGVATNSCRDELIAILSLPSLL